jgi:hypothetical protein
MDRLFETKGELKSYLRGHVEKMPLWEPLQGFDLELALGVLDIHRHGQEKIGVGISEIELRLSHWRKREFWIIRKDGTPMDFTWAKCMDGEPPRRYYQHGALREAVRGQIQDFRRSVFAGGKAICAITGVRLVNDATTHIDHHDPLFRDLADTFILAEGGVVAFGEPKDTSAAASMTDPAQKARWQAFHAEMAVLRPTTKKANLSRPRASAA